jgi:hypothetical protein
MAKLKDAAKNQGNNGRWDQSFKDEVFAIPGKSTPVRLWEEVKEIRQHWVEFISQTKGKTGYGEMCLNWDPVNEKTVEGGCPLCEAGKKPTTYYYGFLINRRVQQKSGNTVVQPIRMTAKLAGKIGKLSEIAYADLGDDAPDATDQKKGFDVLISQTNTNGKIEYEAHAGDKKPLTKDEVEAFEEYVAEHDLGKLAKGSMRPRAELVESLGRRGVEGFSAQKASASNGAAKKRNYEDYDSPDDEEDAVVPAKKAAAKPAAAAKRSSLTGDDEEEEAPRRKPARKTALDDDEEEDATPSRRYATADEDDVPDEE